MSSPRYSWFTFNIICSFPINTKTHKHHIQIKYQNLISTMHYFCHSPQSCLYTYNQATQETCQNSGICCFCMYRTNLKLRKTYGAFRASHQYSQTPELHSQAHPSHHMEMLHCSKSLCPKVSFSHFFPHPIQAIPASKTRSSSSWYIRQYSYCRSKFHCQFYVCVWDILQELTVLSQ